MRYLDDLRRWMAPVTTVPAQGVRELVERLNLRHVWRWLGLAGVVGLVVGMAALAFNWLTDRATTLFWGSIVGWIPRSAGGEPTEAALGEEPWLVGLVLAPMLGGLASAFVAQRLAPGAKGHGTDGAIRAYHRQRGEIPTKVPFVKMIASALTLGSGGSAGREGPIMQIGAGLGSALGGLLKLGPQERRILLAAGMAAGIGAVFRAPLAGAIFAAEVLYSGPDIESDVLIPALLASIVSYSLYCSVNGFGHLFTGTTGFAFTSAAALPAYALLGLVCGAGAITFVRVLEVTETAFKRVRLSPYLLPALGAGLTGALGAAAWLATGDLDALGVMGSGYGTLQHAVGAGSGVAGPSLVVLAVVAFGKMVTTGLTVGSGGSGGLFGPSMVIGGCLGGLVGGVLHALFPNVVPEVGPFTIVGMAGFFAGAANAPIATLLIVGDLTGNYSLFLPAMLAVGISFIVSRRWSLFREQVPTRADSPAHSGEFEQDALLGLRVGDVVDRARPVVTLTPDAPLWRIVDLVASSNAQQYFPVVDGEGRVCAGFGVQALRQALANEDLVADLVVAQDLAEAPVLGLRAETDLHDVVGLFGLRDASELPVLDSERRLVGLLSQRDLLVAYARKRS